MILTNIFVPVVKAQNHSNCFSLQDIDDHSLIPGGKISDSHGLRKGMGSSNSAGTVALHEKFHRKAIKTSYFIVFESNDGTDNSAFSESTSRICALG